MDEVIRARLNTIHDTVGTYIKAAQCALTNTDVNSSSSEELEVTQAKLKCLNERLVSEIHNYCKMISEPNLEVVNQYTLTQIQAEELVATLSVRIKNNNQTQLAVAKGENVNITSKLPRMELAKFDGNILNWYQFWDQFSSNVHKRNISDVDKLLYLQSVLEGEAKQAIVGLDTTNKNYTIAVDTLKERYGKPSAIIDAHYVALYRIKAATTSQIKDCRHVLSEIERHLRVLSSLGENVNHNHLRVMIMEKFPEDLIYELRMKMSNDDDTIDNIRKYLEHIISARETSSRLRKEMSEEDKTRNSIEKTSRLEHFTMGSLHVKTEDAKYSRQRKLTTFKNDKAKLENKQYNKFKPSSTKRLVGTSDGTDEPPKKKSLKCIFCSKGHYNDECTSYNTIQDRKLKLGNRCYNCLSVNHRANKCGFKRKCRHCGKFGIHNRALCPSRLDRSVKHMETENLHVKSTVGSTVLQTCLVNVSNPDNERKRSECRVLLDCGSQRSYITENMAAFLNLTVNEKMTLSVFTFGKKSPRQIDSDVVNIQLHTRTGLTRLLSTNVVPYICNNIRTPDSDVIHMAKNDPRFKNLILADDGTYGEKIDILIGNDYYHSFMSNEKILLTTHLYLVNSIFGWIWSGKVNERVDTSEKLRALTYFQSNGALNCRLNEPDLPLKYDDVKMLWDLESIGISDSPHSTRDEEALKQFNDTIIFKNNRYYVQWPWSNFPVKLLDNFGLACGRLKSLVKRLDTVEIKLYDDIIQEQIRHKIIEIVPNPNVHETHPVHYLPHHCVRNRDKPNKLRIVYDASAKIKDNHSLNECLHRGPLMLEDLTSLLIRFREHPIGITADVEKAFLQIGLQDADRDVTRFLWLKNIKYGVYPDNILYLRFCRVPFGVISSPFLLNATIKYHLEKSECSLMKQLAEDIYVDNVVTGARTLTEGLKIYTTSKQLFDSLSMNLRDWNSNSRDLLSSIPNKFRADPQDRRVKVLGLIWDIDKDSLYLKPSSDYGLHTVQSKRDVLKIIASVYDPCGFAVPLMLPVKLFFQNLWKLKIKWDSSLNDDLYSLWRQHASKLNFLKCIEVDRYFSKNLFKRELVDNVQYELHCFSDASLEAYAAVIYLRSCFEDDSVVSFVIGKSRLVPIKNKNPLHIPRLELLGALIGSRLMIYVVKCLRIKIKCQYLWTDSKVVLSWHKSEKLLAPFISRRINEIRQNRMLEIRYVPSKLNPADIGTRADRVDSYRDWLIGPKFLSEDLKQWPIQPSSEVSQNYISLAGEGLTNQSDSSNFNKIEQVTVYTSDKPNNEETQKILQTQAEHFPKEVKGIITDLSRSLNLFKDQNGILRCRGRFKYTDLTYSQKMPVLLPKNAEFTHKLIEDLHIKNYHVGVSHTLALLRQKFWVTHGRATVQKIIRKCQMCVKYGGGPFKLPPMPDLPAERVKLCVPFAFTGLDYFGPLIVNETVKEKRWICLYTCLTIRAVHMEVVKDLSAEECLLAMRRFIASRGLPQLIVSDNASQFKLTADTIASDYCIKNKIRWKFIPELAPWFGGFYERLIGLVKNSMKRTLDKHLINNNQLCTVIKELEAVVNTRPLTTVGAELEHILAPIDFLRIGGNVNTETSDIEFLESATVTKTNLIDSWKRGQVILSEFSKMFCNQYLTSLRERRDKHRQPRIVVDRAPKLSESVQLKSDGSRVHWRVGKIIDLIKGSDGQVRVAKVKVSTGETFTRSISHLYPLEIDDDPNSTTVPVENNPGVRSDQVTEEFPCDQPPPDTQMQNDRIQNINSKLDAVTEPQPQTTADLSNRGSRSSAVRARDKIKQWTSQFMIRMF